MKKNSFSILSLPFCVAANYLLRFHVPKLKVTGRSEVSFIR